MPRLNASYGGGVAGIIPQEGAHVEGVVYKISDKDLKILDGFEGVDQGEYTRQRVAQITVDGQTIKIDAHIASVQHGYPFPATASYADKILSGAKENELSKDYIETVLVPLLTDTV